MQPVNRSVLARRTDSLFAPLNKQAMKLAGLEQEDEMHFFAHVLGVTTLCSEINIADSLWTTRVTSHVPLKDVANLVTTDCGFMPRSIRSTQCCDATAANLA